MLQLPPEIVSQILGHLPTEDVKVCRLVCRDLDVLAFPFVYNTVHIYLNNIDCYQRNLFILKAIISPEGQQLSIGKHVKHVCIHSHSDKADRPKHQVVWNGIIKSQRRLEERIYTSLPFMIALKKITWNVTHPISQRFIGTVMRLAPHKPIAVDLKCHWNCLSLFTDMTCIHGILLDCYNAAGMGLLLGIIARNPKLKALRIHMYSPQSVLQANIQGSSSLSNLFSKIPPGTATHFEQLSIGGFCLGPKLPLARLRHLKALNINFSDEKIPGDLWDFLRREGVHLMELCVCATSSALLDYLGSYEGLERLKIHTNNDDAHAEQFYHDVLPKHASTIEELWVHPKRRAGPVWGLDTCVLDRLRRCRNLTELHIPVGLQSVTAVTDDDVVTCMLNTLSSLQWPSLNILRFFSTMDIPAGASFTQVCNCIAAIRLTASVDSTEIPGPARLSHILVCVDSHAYKLVCTVDEHLGYIWRFRTVHYWERSDALGKVLQSRPCTLVLSFFQLERYSEIIFSSEGPSIFLRYSPL
ncbi:hypothetical protein DFS33DRAFT_288271 [Desarmillaria ectypa]|nr:hypothetical protein DFS33DRAFT_288271 [Desarmillaria ectypa]